MGRSSPFFNTRCNLGLYTYKLFTDAFGFDGATDRIKMATIVNGEPIGKWLNTLRPRQNGRRIADDTFNRIFVNENFSISIKCSLKFVPKGPINNIPALVQIMAWRRPGDKPLSEPMMVRLLTHICIARPQWVLTHCHRGDLNAILEK